MVSRSTIVVFVAAFTLLGLFLGIGAAFDTPSGHLALTVEKSEYSRGEEILFTATNQGNLRLVFSYSSLQLYVANVDTGENHHVIQGQIFNYLEPGESEMITWNYKRDGELGPGNYVGKISTAAAGGHPVIRVEARFTVTG